MFDKLSQNFWVKDGIFDQTKIKMELNSLKAGNKSANLKPIARYFLYELPSTDCPL